MPTFSIVTCTRNSIAHLDASVCSVLNQEKADLEIIFVDGGSTDGTLEYIANIPRQCTLVQNISGGISRAMNAGILAATGDIIAHLHSDDYYAHSQVLSTVAKLFTDSSRDWLFGRCLADIDGVISPENYTVPRYSRTRLLKGNFIPHPATFVRSRLFSKVELFSETLRYAMDYDMWLRLSADTEPLQVDEHLAVFRRHAGSTSTANRLAAQMEDYAVRKRYISQTPWSRAYHWAHYLVRKRRIVQALKPEQSMP